MVSHHNLQGILQVAVSSRIRRRRGSSRITVGPRRTEWSIQVLEFEYVVLARRAGSAKIGQLFLGMQGQHFVSLLSCLTICLSLSFLASARCLSLVTSLLCITASLSLSHTASHCLLHCFSHCHYCLSLTLLPLLPLTATTASHCHYCLSLPLLSL